MGMKWNGQREKDGILFQQVTHTYTPTTPNQPSHSVNHNNKANKQHNCLVVLLVLSCRSAYPHSENNRQEKRPKVVWCKNMSMSCLSLVASKPIFNYMRYSQSFLHSVSVSHSISIPLSSPIGFSQWSPCLLRPRAWETWFSKWEAVVHQCSMFPWRIPALFARAFFRI